MDRREFLKRAGMGTAAVVVGPRLLELAPSAPVVSAAPVAMSATSVSITSLTASGGLCAPLSPIYDLPSFARPIREALPTFSAKRGGIELS